MKGDLISIIICSFIFLLLIATGIILRCGKGAFLISGYHMLSKEEKAKYNEKALCRFVGNMVFVIAAFFISAVIAGIYEITWFLPLITVMISAFTISRLIYANTNNRFKK